MRTVLGFATTQTTVEIIRIEGFGADEANVAREFLRIQTDDEAPSSDPYAQLASRVWFRMRRLARADDHPVRSVGVTWSQGGEYEASLLVAALHDAGFDNVVAVDSRKASRELAWARGSDTSSVPVPDPGAAPLIAADSLTMDGEPTRGTSDALVRWLDTVVEPATGLAAPEAGLALALGAALASTHSVGQARRSDRPRPRLRMPRVRMRSKAGVVAVGLALLVLSSGGPSARQTSEVPSRPDEHPRLGTTQGGWAVVPVPSAPLHRVQAPLPEVPSAPPPAVAPETVGVSPSPLDLPELPALPELPELQELPSSATISVPLTSPPQLPSVPEPGDQPPLTLPDSLPDPPASEQAPPGTNCVLLCGVVI